MTFLVGPLAGLLGREADWGILDEPLRRVADRSGSKHVLEVDFRPVTTRLRAATADARIVEMHLANTLARFVEKGRLIFPVDVFGWERESRIPLSDRVV